MHVGTLLLVCFALPSISRGNPCIPMVRSQGVKTTIRNRWKPYISGIWHSYDSSTAPKKGTFPVNQSLLSLSVSDVPFIEGRRTERILYSRTVRTSVPLVYSVYCVAICIFHFLSILSIAVYRCLLLSIAVYRCLLLSIAVYFVYRCLSLSILCILSILSRSRQNSLFHLCCRKQ
jgi:hypothetical protein